MALLNWERCESWSCRSDLRRHLIPAGPGGRGSRGVAQLGVAVWTRNSVHWCSGFRWGLGDNVLEGVSAKWRSRKFSTLGRYLLQCYFVLVTCISCFAFLWRICQNPPGLRLFFFPLFPDLRTSVLGAGAQGNELFPKTPQVREFMLETFTSQYYVRQVHKDLLVSRKWQGLSSEELSHVIALVLLL